MNLAEKIHESVKPLPPAAAREVLDFVEFIARRHADALAEAEAHDLMRAQQTALRDWDHEDDEAWNHAPGI